MIDLESNSSYNNEVLFQEVQERWNTAKNQLTQHYDQCDDMYKLYASWSTRRSQKFFNNIDIPLGFKIIETLVPYLVASSPNPGVTATRSEDTLNAIRLNRQIKSYLNTPEHLNELMEWVKSMLLYGIGIVKDGWNYKSDLHKRWVQGVPELMQLAMNYPTTAVFAQIGDSGMIQNMAKLNMLPGVEFDEATQWFTVYDVDIKDAPTFSVIFPKDYAWLGNGNDPQKMEAHYHRLWYTKHQLRQMIRTGGHQYFTDKLQYAVDNSTEEVTTIQNLQTQINILTPETNSVELIEETRRGTDGRITITTICQSADCVVGQKTLPFFHNKFNYSVLRSFPKTGEYAGTPMLKIVESLLACVNKLSNEILDNGSLAMQNVFINRKGAKIKDKQINIFAGAVLPGRPDDWKMLEMKDVRRSTLQISEMFIGFLESITGVTDFNNQKTAPAIAGTAGGLEQLQFNQTARIKVQHYLDTLGLSTLVERIASNIKQFVRTEVEIPVKDENNTTSYIKINPQDVTGRFSFEVDIKSMQATNNSVARAQLQALLNIAVGVTEAYEDKKTGQITARRIFDVRKMGEELLRSYDVFDRPENYVMNPERVEAIPPQQLPPPREVIIQQTGQQMFQQQALTPPQPPGMPPQGMGQGQGMGMRPGQGAPPGMGQGMRPPMLGQGLPQTATGTTGMPPVLGGGQQSGVISPQQVPLPKTIGAAAQSGRSLQ